MQLLSPYEPTDADPFDEARAAHLARRAGFGATRARLRELVALGPERAVASYTDFPARDEALEAELSALGGPLVDFSVAPGVGPLDPLRRWWIHRMVHGTHELQEKLTLLWHDHFACQESKVVRLPMLLDQNRTFRQYGAGPFRALLGAVARDPAMLHYLDNRLSTKEAPNENWARELLELFALGVDHYTQEDIVELARVFTGWTTPGLGENTFQFDAALHDAEDKVLFGEGLRGRDGDDGVLEGEEALDRIVARPDCARFLATKLLGWFGAHDMDLVGDSVVDELAAVLAEHDLDIRVALRTLFRSRWFFDPARRFAMVRNPVTYVVAAARAIAVQNADRAGLERATSRMGMRLLEPPSVGGWEHGLAWAGPGTAAARLEVALALSELPHASRRIVGRATIDVDALLDGDELAAEDPSDGIVDALLHRLWPEAARSGSAPLDDVRHAALVSIARGALDRAPAELAPQKRLRAAVRATLHMVLALPEVALE
ncbi:MAG: DUF1800 domain-containing protein [Planctomycetota bacterium]